MCALCLKTKFGFFNRGVKCSLCCYLVCGACTHSVRIQEEHFSTTPSILLSPSNTSPLSHTPLSQLGVAGLAVSDSWDSCDSCAQYRPASPCHPPPILSINTVTVTMESVQPSDMDKQATLSRWSMSMLQEEMEDCQMTVCTDCRIMVIQVGVRS